MKKMFVGNLPSQATEEGIAEVFSQFGTVRSIDLVRDVFSGQCRGFGFVEMEGHEARAAMAALDGRDFGGKAMRVRFEDKRNIRRRARR
ncbi:MAG: RNA-binding protein [Gammaproteobacteria bacterium]|nr:RNA-binding protein [Gammaproteobacteria bacterium]